MEGIGWRLLESGTHLNQALVLAIFLVTGGILAAVAIATVAHGIGAGLDGMTEKLRLSEELHRDILATAMDGFWLVDLEGRILDTNEAYCRISGYARNELLGLKISDLEASESSEAVTRHMELIIDRNGDRFETMHRRKDGSLVPIETSVKYRPLHDGRFVVFLRDITDRTKAEKELRRSAEENRSLLSELQHRVKNSFNVISGLIDLAAASDDSESARRVLQSLGERVRSVSELYSFLYASGSFSLVRLDEYCAKVAEAIFGLAPRISFSAKMEALVVNATTAAPLGLILTEFITNSLKYAFPDGAQGRVELVVAANGRTGRIELRDDGAGLAPDFAGKSGTGLGLAQGLAAQIGGRCGIERLVRGTLSFVEFPLERAENRTLVD